MPESNAHSVAAPGSHSRAGAMGSSCTAIRQTRLCIRAAAAPELVDGKLQQARVDAAHRQHSQRDAACTRNDIQHPSAAARLLPGRKACAAALHLSPIAIPYSTSVACLTSQVGAEEAPVTRQLAQHLHPGSPWQWGCDGRLGRWGSRVCAARRRQLGAQRRKHKGIALGTSTLQLAPSSPLPQRWWSRQPRTGRPHHCAQKSAQSSRAGRCPPAAARLSHGGTVQPGHGSWNARACKPHLVNSTQRCASANSATCSPCSTLRRGGVSTAPHFLSAPASASCCTAVSTSADTSCFCGQVSGGKCGQKWLSS